MKRFREWLGKTLISLGIRIFYAEALHTWKLAVLTKADYEKQLAEMARAETAMQRLFTQARADGWGGPVSEMKLRNGSRIELYGDDVAFTGHKPPEESN